MAQINEIAAVVTQHINKELYDGLGKINPLWNQLITKGKEKITGGTSLQFPIKLFKNTSSSFIPGAGAIVDINPSIQFQYGVLNWKYNYFSVNFTLEDFTQTYNAKEQIVNYIEKKKELAKADYYRGLSTAVYGTSATNPLSFDGLQDITAGSGTAYAGLIDTDYTDATNPYLPYIATDTQLSYAVISNLIIQSRARSQRDGEYGKLLGLMNPYLFNQMLGVLQNQQMFVNQNRMVGAGFEAFNINGVEFYMDVDCPGTGDGVTQDNYIFVIPETVLKLAYKYGVDASSPFDGEKQIPNQPIVTIQKYMAGNLMCTNRRTISVAKNLA